MSSFEKCGRCIFCCNPVRAHKVSGLDLGKSLASLSLLQAAILVILQVGHIFLF